MSDLGRLLSEARTAKDLSFADVEDATRIRQKYLEAFETGAFDELPAGAVSRGFLRIYARYLGVDVEEALALYEQASGDHGGSVPIAEPGSPRYIDYRPLEVNLAEPGSSMGWLRWLFALLIVGAIAAAGWYLLNSGSRTPSIALFALPPTEMPTQTVTPWVVTATPEAAIAAVEANAEATLPAPTSDLLTLPTPTVPPTITPTPRPTATPEVLAGVILDVEAEQRSWLRAVVDGELVEESVLRVGDTRSWVADQSITLRTGNGAGIHLTLNGEDLGNMGGVGEVVERTWVVDQGEVTEAVGPTPTLLPTATSTATPSG
jgi:cytoskeleton protein RodZ